LTRPQAQRLIESHGGQVVLIPDKSTTHSVIGHGVTKNKLTILDRLQIAPLDEQGLVQMIQEMPANGRWEESPVRGEHSEPAISDKPNTMTSPPNEAVRGATHNDSEMPAPREDTVGTTDNDRTNRSWPFNEPPNLVRHVQAANPAQEVQTIVKDESTEVASVADPPPEINHSLRKQYATSWGTPQVRRGNLTKIKFAVNYEKGESRLVKHEVRRRGGKIVRISQADVLVLDRHYFSIANTQTTQPYRPGWQNQIQSEKFFEAFPAVEVLPFEVNRETNSPTAVSAGQSPSNVVPSGVAGIVGSATASIEKSDSLTSGAVTSHDNVRIFRSGTIIMRTLNGHTRSLFSVKPTIGSSKHREWKKTENTDASLEKDMRILKITLVISRNGERRLICGRGTWQRSTKNWENWRRAPCIDRSCVRGLAYGITLLFGMEYNASPLLDNPSL
jgi:hypothetical protein